jgi:hypothetical protein
MKCNAKTRSGTPCQKAPIRGKVRCRLHGGLSPSGENHWNYKHGQRTKQASEANIAISLELKLLEKILLVTDQV